MSNSLYGPLPDVAGDAGHVDHPPRMGFFTDTSVCIGCKACEVACKQWNGVPAGEHLDLLGMSHDNTGELGANHWRHVAFIEQPAPGPTPVDLGMPGSEPPGRSSGAETRTDFRWLMASDVCKHCTHAGCLDVCPTGALFRTEFGTVVVQDDVCNGCGTCVAGCPFGVIERRSDGTFATGARSDSPDVRNEGVAQKCTLCYDRIKDGQTPACAQTCPTTSIKYGDHYDLVAQAKQRVADLHEQGMTEARLYGANANDGVGGTGSVFLLLDEPEVYGLPPDPRVPTADLPRMFNRAGVAGLGMIAAVVVSFLTGRRR